MSIATYKKTCVVCGKNFIAHKSHAKCCSAACRGKLRLIRSNNVINVNNDNNVTIKTNVNNDNNVNSVSEQTELQKVLALMYNISDYSLWDKDSIEIGTTEFYNIGFVDEREIGNFAMLSEEFGRIAYQKGNRRYKILIPRILNRSTKEIYLRVIKQLKTFELGFYYDFVFNHAA